MRTSDRGRRHVAVLDADPGVAAYIGEVLADRFKVSVYTQAAELVQSLKDGASPDLVMLDWLSTEDESDTVALGLLSKIRTLKPSLPVVLLACSADLNELLACARMGSVEILLKPFRKSDINEAVEQGLDSRTKQVSDGDAKEIPLDENTSFVRSSKRMQEVESQCTLVARADIPVLILGESGTGKEVAAMLIHKVSSRSKLNFLKLNCAAMPADLLESELFGYEQGAFTGAVKAKPGKFELCDKGTIFLDEIGEMPAALQAKLLQVLQDGSFSRLGSRSSSIKVDVRVIAATNIDIKEAIARKSFREDLYYRLNGFTVKMPPLRERTQEIPLLTAYFMRKATAKYGCDPLPISPALMQVLTRYAWPGNLRELENTIKRYLVLRDEKAIMDDLSPAQVNKLLGATAEANEESTSLKALVKSLKGNAEAVAIAQTLEETGWNRKVAASTLKISYKALLYKIKQYSLSPLREQHGVGKKHAEMIRRSESYQAGFELQQFGD